MVKELTVAQKQKLGAHYQELRETLKNPKDKECSQRELCKLIGVANSRISDIESGKRTPTINEVKAYHNYFKVSYEYLMGESNNKNRDNVDIGNVIGLTDGAIEILKKIHAEDIETGSRKMDALNSLISRENDISFIKLLEEYMYFDLTHIIGNVGAENNILTPLLRINAETIRKSYLVATQDALIKLREREVKNNG